MQYPFAENAVVVQMIIHDLTNAIIAVPVLIFGIFRGYRAANRGDATRSTIYAVKCLFAAGWICYFLKGWVIPADITIDLADLRRQTADPAFFGKGRIGYFNCTLQLSPTQSVHWSARKIGALKLADGSGFLWIEGNADEPQAVVDALAEVSKTLHNGVPSTADVAAHVQSHRDNTVPMFTTAASGIDAKVMIFREPNMLVTPCLWLRY